MSRDSRVVAVIAIGLALVAIALEIAYAVGAFVLGVVHRVV
jgi:hypothetical protein